MRFRLLTRKRRRMSYSLRMASISASQRRRAVTAAYWLVVGAHMMADWWIFVITLMIGSGPQA